MQIQFNIEFLRPHIAKMLIQFLKPIYVVTSSEIQMRLKVISAATETQWED